jgi:hypothetical protein
MYMFEPTDPETFWLNVTNISLGLVTLIALGAVLIVAFREIAKRVRARVAVRSIQDDHAFTHADLGLTMADGGERLDEHPPLKTENDAPNIDRSVN